jgi:hypothetical protein
MLIVAPSVGRGAYAISVGVAEALGYSPKVIERSLLVLLEHVSLPVPGPPSDQRTIFVFRMANREHLGDAEVKRDPSALGEVLGGVDL